LRKSGDRHVAREYDKKAARELKPHASADGLCGIDHV